MRSQSTSQGSIWLTQIDVLPLCTFRIIFGLILVLWYTDLAPDINLLFTDDGLYPRELILAHRNAHLLSLMDWASHPAGAAVFFCAGFTCAFLLLVGWRTRFMAVANFIFIASIQHRNPLLWDGADTAIRVFSFWLMFCPSGRVWSIDAIRAARKGASLSRFALAPGLRILQLQLAFIYLITAWGKLHGLMWLNGTALYYSFHLGPAWDRQLAYRFAASSTLILLGTVGTLLFEILFLPMVFSPWWQPRLKAVALICGTMFHLLIAFTLKIGWFSYVMVACYVLFFEPNWIENIRRTVEPYAEPFIDRVKGLVYKIDIRRFIGTVSLAEKGQFFYRDSFKKADVRYPVYLGASYAYRGVLVSLFVLTLWYCLDPSSKAIHRALPLPAQAEKLVATLGLTQGWMMFAPFPYPFQAHVEIEGHLVDGRRVDLLRAGYGQGGWNRTKPYYEGWYFSRWVKFFESTIYAFNYRKPNPYLVAYEEAICRQYNKQRPVGSLPLASLQIKQVIRDTPRPGEAEQEWRQEEISRCQCDNDLARIPASYDSRLVTENNNP